MSESIKLQAELLGAQLLNNHARIEAIRNASPEDEAQARRFDDLIDEAIGDGNDLIEKHKKRIKGITLKTETIQELRSQNADLLAALKLCLPVMGAWAEASHLIEGFARKESWDDRVLARVKRAVAEAEGREE